MGVIRRPLAVSGSAPIGACSKCSDPRILLVFGCFEGAPPRHIFQGFSLLETSFLIRSVGDVGHFFWLVFCMAWARILLVFGCFEGTPPMAFIPRVFAVGDYSFLMRSVGDLGLFFLARVLHGMAWLDFSFSLGSPSVTKRTRLLLTPFFCDLDGALPF